jgi:hypothetical protein
MEAFGLVRREVIPFQNLVFEHDCLSSMYGARPAKGAAGGKNETVSFP